MDNDFCLWNFLQRQKCEDVYVAMSRCCVCTSFMNLKERIHFNLCACFCVCLLCSVKVFEPWNITISEGFSESSLQQCCLLSPSTQFNCSLIPWISWKNRFSIARHVFKIFQHAACNYIKKKSNQQFCKLFKTVILQMSKVWFKCDTFSTR